MGNLYLSTISEAFYLDIKKVISRATKLAAHGGDRKSETYSNQVGASLILYLGLLILIFVA